MSETTPMSDHEKVVAELREYLPKLAPTSLTKALDVRRGLLLLDLIAQQAATIERLTDGEIVDMRMENGAIDLAVTSKALEHLALVLTEHFRASGAKNYIEMSLHAKTEPFESYVVTVQKRNGAKTPHELREAAESALTAAEAEVGRLRDALEPFAKIADEISNKTGVPERSISDETFVTLRLGECRRARACLSSKKEG